MCALIKEGSLSFTVPYALRFLNELTFKLNVTGTCYNNIVSLLFYPGNVAQVRFGLRVTYHIQRLWYLLLGKKKFLLGERACSADSAVFGLLAQIHWHSYGSEAENVYKSRWLICVVQFYLLRVAANTKFTFTATG